ncbi:DUF2322 family protein [Rodentibacter trehalosifermentans]|uniref:RNA polymerase subunit sigma-32 n=1 Tax=Rodentibacter trehalosifermentans TaxID=1908263 RepID=A0A1V3IV29_9PAST|nr:DUF2322 family protein [Rodentibacter trehalosifermentans]OOF45759.1 hypothetical protein BKK51_05460 [Rodentibacter trehalosifermentans]OOF49342.1 hypothetical protein BKK52_03935 [Rodentibacter trehalosifermentans]OOF51341.1 hypothetical protein BKK53_07305 [Rodentibacter trehalosifermentans]
MAFKEILDELPTIDHLSGLNVKQGDEIIHHIPAIPGKLGSLRLYHALAEKFNGKLDRTSAQQGIEWFAEYVEDAKKHPGKHPNIDLLFNVVEKELVLHLELLKNQQEN